MIFSKNSFENSSGSKRNSIGFSPYFILDFLLRHISRNSPEFLKYIIPWKCSRVPLGILFFRLSKVPQEIPRMSNYPRIPLAFLQGFKSFKIFFWISSGNSFGFHLAIPLNVLRISTGNSSGFHPAIPLKFLHLDFIQ